MEGGASSSSGSAGSLFQGFAQFGRHMGRFDGSTKRELLNLLQYALLAIAPVVLLNKAMQAYVPDPDDERSTWTLAMEVLGQVAALLLGLYLVHRFVLFFPTWSDEPYPDSTLQHSMLAMLTVLLSMQTKIGVKVEWLAQRAQAQLQRLQQGGAAASGASGAGGARAAAAPHAGAAGQAQAIAHAQAHADQVQASHAQAHAPPSFAPTAISPIGGAAHDAFQPEPMLDSLAGSSLGGSAPW